MRVIAMWLRVDLRRRARSLAVLALLVALSSGTVMTALAGARRGDSTIERLTARTSPATAAVLANTAGFDWRPVQRLPEVESLTRFVVDYTMTIDGVTGDALGFPPGDDATMRTIERPVVYRGRVFDPRRADEVVVSRKFVKHFHRGVGDVLTIHLPTPKELAASDNDPGVLHGPTVKARIVGVVTSPWWVDQVGNPGFVQVSPGLTAKYPANVVGDQSNPQDPSYINVLVRLKGGEAALPQFRRDLARVTGRSDLDVWNLPQQAQEQQRNLTFESLCLAAFGVAAMAAAVFLAGQSIARYAAASVDDLRSVQALGMTPREAIVTATVGPAMAGAFGALLGGVAAYLVSGRFPIGSAGYIEPSPGRLVDWVVIAPGVLVTVLLVAGGAALSARSALVAHRRPLSRSATSALLSHGNLPIPLVIGSRFALERGRGRTAVPVRPALVGAVVGILGITAAFTFSYAVSDAARTPERFGQTYTAISFVGINGQTFGSVDDLVGALARMREVTGVDHATTGVVGNPSGSASVSLFTYSPGPKPLRVILTRGRMPKAADEIALAPRSIAALHTAVGRRVLLVGSGGRERYLVTGAGFVPTGPHNGYAEGAWVTRAGFRKAVDKFKFDVVLISTRHPVDERAAQALTAAVVRRNPKLKDFGIGPPDALQVVAQIKDVEVLPVLLGVFLVLLAVGAVGHALATAVRRRARDLAVLRALGMTPWQCRWIVITQSTLLGLIGLVLGVPLGVALGRVIWRGVADYTPLQYVAPLAGLELVLVIPAALVLANVLGAWPGHRAAHLRVSRVLRTE